MRSLSFRNKLLLGCALTAAAVAGVVLPVWPREPTYLGKPLSLWLHTYAPFSSAGRGSREWNQADDAVRHMGTNCIPTLLHMLREKDSKIKLRLVALAQKQQVIKIRFVPAAERNAEASKAFLALGDQGQGAVPALVKMCTENISPDSELAIEDTLAWLGPPAKPAVPFLLQAATNPNRRVCANALWALGEIHADSQLCVPELVHALNDADDWVCLSAAHALGKFGAEAQPAVPSLTQLAKFSPGYGSLFASKLQVSIEARNALKKIQPESVSPLTATGAELGPGNTDWWTSPTR